MVGALQHLVDLHHAAHAARHLLQQLDLVQDLLLRQLVLHEVLDLHHLDRRQLLTHHVLGLENLPLLSRPRLVTHDRVVVNDLRHRVVVNNTQYKPQFQYAQK